ESEERFHLVVDNVQDYSIILLSPEGNVVSWNEGAQRIKGYQALEILGRHFSTFHTPESVQTNEPAKLLLRAEREGRVQTEGWRVRKDGTRFFADVLLTALRDNEGHLKGFAKITRDITEKRQMDELARSNRELE